MQVSAEQRGINRYESKWRGKRRWCSRGEIREPDRQTVEHIYVFAEILHSDWKCDIDNAPEKISQIEQVTVPINNWRMIVMSVYPVTMNVPLSN